MLNRVLWPGLLKLLEPGWLAGRTSDPGLGAQVQPGQQGARAAPSPSRAAPRARAGSRILRFLEQPAAVPGAAPATGDSPAGRRTPATLRPGGSPRG